MTHTTRGGEHPRHNDRAHRLHPASARRVTRSRPPRPRHRDLLKEDSERFAIARRQRPPLQAFLRPKGIAEKNASAPADRESKARTFSERTATHQKLLHAMRPAFRSSTRRCRDHRHGRRRSVGFARGEPRGERERRHARTPGRRVGADRSRRRFGGLCGAQVLCRKPDGATNQQPKVERAAPTSTRSLIYSTTC